MLVWAAVIVVLVVLATLGWYQLRERPAAAPQRDATTAAQSSAPTQPAEPSPRPPEAAAPPQATPAVAAPVVAAPPVDTTPAPARTARRLYAVQVAAVRSQAQANAIEARLSRRTRMEGRVLHDAGKPWYRVVLGEYDNMDVASRAADSLVRADVVDMGVAVALPPSAPSQPR
jgi:cell division protein FtsN